MHPTISLQPMFKTNDTKAKWLIGIFSVVVFVVITILSRFKLDVDPGFDVHIFALINAVLNSIIAILLVAALVAVKQKKFHLHKSLMLGALYLSIAFLVSYIAHHLLAGDTRFGDLNGDNVLSDIEKASVGNLRYFYLVILLSHIFLAGIILPIILFTAYRGLTGEYSAHKKIARITWPLWFYVAVTGPLVYWLISPYYQA